MTVKTVMTNTASEMDLLSKARKLGAKAANADERADTNPYHYDKQRGEFDTWREGWKAAFMKKGG